MQEINSCLVWLVWKGPSKNEVFKYEISFYISVNCAMLSSLLLFGFHILIAHAFDSNSSENVAVYWGLNGGKHMRPLADYCTDTSQRNADIIILSFINATNPLDMSLDTQCSGIKTKGSNINQCPDIGNDIKTCQSHGKIVLVSLGGQWGNYNLTSDDEGRELATTLWQTFGNGSNPSIGRPFGDSIVDGFDLDLEQNNQTGYVEFADQMKEYFDDDNNTKDYYLAAAPQCPYPDKSLSEVLNESHIDFAFIQFYNNECASSKSFNWDTWENFAANTAPNKNIRLFMGLPATSSINGYLTPAALRTRMKLIKDSPYFGGISIWDASYASKVIGNGENFITKVKQILEKEEKNTSAPLSLSYTLVILVVLSLCL